MARYRGMFADCTYIIVGILQYIFTTTSFQEGPHQKLFFHLQESEDERRARVNENDLARFLRGTIFIV